MPILAITIVFCISWWLVFMMVMSVGVKTQADQGERVQGTMGGAPINPNLGKKALWATYGAAGLTFAFWCVIMIVKNVM